MSQGNIKSKQQKPQFTEAIGPIEMPVLYLTSTPNGMLSVKSIPSLVDPNGTLWIFHTTY